MNLEQRVKVLAAKYNQDAPCLTRTVRLDELVDTMSDVRKGMKRSLERYKVRCQELIVENRRLQVKVTECEKDSSSHKDCTRSIRSLQARLQRLENYASHLHTTLQHVDTLHEVYLHSTSLVEQSRDVPANLSENSDISINRNSRETNKTMSAAASSQISDMASNKRQTDLQGNPSDLESKLTDALTQVHNLTQSLVERETEVAQLKKELDEHKTLTNRTMAELQGKLCVSNEERDSLSEQLLETTEMNSQFERVVWDLAQSVKEIKQEVSKKDIVNSSLQNEVEVLRGRLAASERQAQEFEKLYRDKSLQAEMLASHVEQLHSELRGLKAKEAQGETTSLADLLNEVTEYKVLVETLQADFLACRTELEGCKSANVRLARDHEALSFCKEKEVGILTKKLHSAEKHSSTSEKRVCFLSPIPSIESSTSVEAPAQPDLRRIRSVEYNQQILVNPDKHSSRGSSKRKAKGTTGKAQQALDGQTEVVVRAPEEVK